MSNDKLINHVGRPVLLPLSALNLISIIALISSVFIWIWGSGDLAWKVAVSSFILIMVSAGLYHWVKSIVKESLQDNSTSNLKSKFQTRLDAYMEQQTKNT